MTRIKEVNIKCSSCGNTIVNKNVGMEVRGQLIHKCSRCKRYWCVDYTNEKMTWVRGKKEYTQIRNYSLNLLTGDSHPILN